MPHNIGRMFYYGEQPWHQLGNELNNPANIEEALAAGGLDWEVELVPISAAESPDTIIPHRMAVARKDREPGQKGRIIGVVHPGFRPLQNRLGAQLFDSLLGQGQRIYHTGGYLKNGEVIWLLAKLKNDIQLNSGDVLESYLLFTNSHDGTIPIDIRLTTVRVVCQNTLSMALDQNIAGKVFRRAHDGSYQLLKEEAKSFFNFTIKQCETTQNLFRKFAATACDQAAFQRFLEKLLPFPAKPLTAKDGTPVLRAWETRIESIRASRSEVMAVHRDGISDRDIPAAEDNWWGALNSVTAWVDHVQKTESDRYAHILLGGGDRLKSAALRHITAEVPKP